VYSACGTKPLQASPNYLPIIEDKKLVHGFMDGEGIDKDPDGKWELQPLKIG
jgi:hypothetical protein